MHLTAETRILMQQTVNVQIVKMTALTRTKRKIRKLAVVRSAMI
jgi:hypothetical protein